MIDAKFRSDIAFGYVAQGGIALSGLLFMFVVTRYGSVATYGALMLLVSISSMMGSLLTFRTNEALVAFYKQGETDGNLAQCKFAVAAGICLDMLVGIALFSVLFSADTLIADRILKDANASDDVSLFGCVMFAIATKSSPLAFLQATERIKWVNTISLAENLGKLCIAGYFVIAAQTIVLREAVWAILIPAYGALLVAYPPLICTLFTRLRHTAISREPSLIRSYVRFNIKTFASSTLKAGNQNVDTLVLGLLTDTRIVGIYATFRQFISPISFLSGPFEAVAYPRFVKAVVQRQYDEMRNAIAGVNRKLLRAFGAATVVILPVTIAYSRLNNVPLDSQSYLTFFIMIITVALRAQLWWARPFSNAVNPNLSLVANSVATLFLLLALYPATWSLGMTGTALGMLILALLLNGYWARALVRYA